MVIYTTHLGGAFGNSDEVLYAEFIRAMHRTGDWFTIRYQGHAVLQRPAAPIALYALVAKLVPGEAGMRLAPALLTAASAAICGAIVWTRTKKAGAAALAILVCAATPAVFVYGRIILSDPPLVLATICALWATVASLENPRRFVLVGLALGCAFASKSLAAGIPAAALLPGIVLVLRRHGRRARPWIALLAAAIPALPFYVYNLAVYRGRFIREHFGYNLIARAKGIPGIGMHESYVTHMFSVDGKLLAALLFAGIAAALVLGRRDPVLLVCGAYALVTFGLLSLMGTRLPHYLLPFYPAAAVCVGLVAARLPEAGGLALAAGGVALFYTTSGAAPFDPNVLPATETRDLARAAPADVPIYTIDWYAPAMGYYSDRPWRLLGTSDGWMTHVGSVDLFAEAKNVSIVPPWPTGRWLAAGRADTLAWVAKDKGLPLQTKLAVAGDFELWEAGQ